MGVAMTVNSYLESIAKTAYVRNDERNSINLSITTLRSRANTYFLDDMTNQILFGSYSRGTILPRTMDAYSDVDYMFVFTNDGSKPQTFLKRIRRFVERYYSTSEIAQSNPTIVLNLNHIRFELVPAVQGLFGNLQIPAKARDYNEWLGTDPTGFNAKLVNANQKHANKIKPLIRVMKYWNVKAGYPFEPFMLEQDIVSNDFFPVRGLTNIGGLADLLSKPGYDIVSNASPLASILGNQQLLGNRQLRDYFYSYVDSMSVDNMSTGFWTAQWKKDAVRRAKKIVEQVKYEEAQGLPYTAEGTIKTLLPEV